ncbi:MAG: glycoside hydrolase family 43 protein [Pyrinomonadaceae bacterium]
MSDTTFDCRTESEVVLASYTQGYGYMTLSHECGAAASDATYLNPVYRHDFPDPFILKFVGEYWAYCTGFWRDGRCFGVMHSRDLVNWRELDGALAPLPGEHPMYWAPEVVYENGEFLLYYSVGNERLMHLRVAVAEHPAGPFVDSGHQLTDADFAIDAHVFVDEEGTRWLFYATDFLAHTHIGTGTVRDRMIDPFTLAGEVQPVSRARYDWQVYDPARSEKGGVRWHTVEGPFVLRHKHLYYQMFSGGNWQNLTYGVSYATSDRITRDDEWEQTADGERVLPVLRTIPGQVVGPGHNSVVRGPDNQQLFCIYHRWDGERGRVLAIDRLDWVGERMTVLGASTTPQCAPLKPTFAGFSDGEDLGAGWMLAGGRWASGAGEARQEAAEGEATARCEARSSSFVWEVSLRALEPDVTGAFGIALFRGDELALRFVIAPQEKEARVSWRARGGGQVETRLALPGDFQPRAFHLLRIVVDNALVTIFLDERVVRWQGTISVSPDSAALVTQDARAAFKGFELTAGWEDLFMQPERTLAERGWLQSGDGWRLQGDLLRFEHSEGFNQMITRGPMLESYEAVVNVRLEREASEGTSCYGFSPVDGAREPVAPLLTVEREGESERWSLIRRGHDVASNLEKWLLPENFDPFVMQQFRFRKQYGQLSVYWEATPLGEIQTTTQATKISLYAHRAVVAFDMVRVTAIMP